MPRPSDRRKKRKFVRNVSGKAVMRFERGKTGKRKCALCGKIMHGMPHGKKTSEVGKLSKTQKRPTALLAGTLCNACRVTVLDEAIKVKEGVKSEQNVEFRQKKFVMQLLHRISGGK